MWAQEQDIEAGLKQYCKLPTNSKGNLPLHHLSALAITLQTVKLDEYLDNFKQGNKMTFSVYIKQDFIERALESSKEYRYIHLNILRSDLERGNNTH